MLVFPQAIKAGNHGSQTMKPEKNQRIDTEQTKNRPRGVIPCFISLDSYVVQRPVMAVSNEQIKTKTFTGLLFIIKLETPEIHSCAFLITNLHLVSSGCSEEDVGP